jgi:hypothetical protein
MAVQGTPCRWEILEADKGREVKGEAVNLGSENFRVSQTESKEFPLHTVFCSGKLELVVAVIQLT